MADISELGKNTRFSGSRAVEMGRKGGKQCAKNKKQRKMFREVLDERLKQQDLEDMVDSLVKRAKRRDESLKLFLELTQETNADGDETGIIFIPEIKGADDE